MTENHFGNAVGDGEAHASENNKNDTLEVMLAGVVCFSFRGHCARIPNPRKFEILPPKPTDT